MKRALQERRTNYKRRQQRVAWMLLLCAAGGLFFVVYAVLDTVLHPAAYFTDGLPRDIHGNVRK